MDLFKETTYVSQRHQIPSLKEWIKKSYKSLSDLKEPTPSDLEDKAKLKEVAQFIVAAENMETVMEHFQDLFTIYIEALDMIKAESPKIHEFIVAIHKAKHLQIHEKRTHKGA